MTLVYAQATGTGSQRAFFAGRRGRRDLTGQVESARDSVRWALKVGSDDNWDNAHVDLPPEGAGTRCNRFRADYSSE